VPYLLWRLNITTTPDRFLDWLDDITDARRKMSSVFKKLSA
jgi:ferritin-like metal-binding protein YciE